MAKLQAHYIIQLLQAFFLCEEIVIIFFTLTAFVYYIRKITNVVEVVKPDMFNISPPTSLSCCLVLDSLNFFLERYKPLLIRSSNPIRTVEQCPCPQIRDSSRIVLYLYFHHELIVQIFPHNF